VRWQSRRYLVAPEKMQEFCNAVVKGDEPRNEARGSFYLGVPFDRADGLPEVPERWASYLRKHLTIGKITTVKEAGLVQVDFAAECGIQEGRILTVRGNRRFDYRRLRVVSVKDGSCTAQECFPERYDEPLEPGREVIAERATEAKDDQ